MLLHIIYPPHLNSDFQGSAFCEMWVLGGFMCTSFFIDRDNIFNLYTKETKLVPEQPVRNTYSLQLSLALSRV